jgi:hypothetical protein
VNTIHYDGADDGGNGRIAMAVILGVLMDNAGMVMRDNAKMLSPLRVNLAINGTT